MMRFPALVSEKFVAPPGVKFPRFVTSPLNDVGRSHRDYRMNSVGNTYSNDRCYFLYYVL
jgi:hypothetical protein